jgi:Asp-tRNA(Asn)/Glu-tRNA(Gln) amidotransferase A subunit family amidase
MDELTALSARQASRLMREGDIAAEAYAEALLAKCEAGRHLNAFITLEPDRVREDARAADRRRSAGAKLGALHGLPIPIKDSVNTADYRTTAGTRALRDFRPAKDAPAVTRLREAGAFVLGKTNIHELSFGWTSDNRAFGAVRNPYDASRIPGGSSGGTAAAVAARMAPLGVAEDTQGSIRVPAALCGVCGFRPTTGRYPSDGVAPITPLFDQIGPHARAVDDLVLFDAAMTDDARAVAPALIKGLRLGLVRDYFFAGLDPEVEAVIDAALFALRRAGVELVEVQAPGLADLVSRTTGTIQIHDAARSLETYLRTSGAPVGLRELVDQVSPEIRHVWERSVMPGAPMAVGEEAYAAARDEHRPKLQRLLADAFAGAGIDALVFPATMVAATPIGEATTVDIAGVTVTFHMAVARNITPGSTAGVPGLVLPAGLTKSGSLPVALELDGRSGADRELLAIGLQIEQVLGPLPPPSLDRPGPTVASS